MAFRNTKITAVPGAWYSIINICSKSRILSLMKGWKSERSPRFAALFSTRGGPFRLLLTVPRPPASTSPLLEDSCGQRKHRSLSNRLNAGMYARLLHVPRLLSDGGEKYGLAEW